MSVSGLVQWLQVESLTTTRQPPCISYHLSMPHGSHQRQGWLTLPWTCSWYQYWPRLKIGSSTASATVPYAAYSHFHTWGAESTKARVDTLLIGTIIPLLPGLQERLESGINVADMGCGSGHAMIVLAQAFPQSRLPGYDLSEEAIAAARAETRQLGLSNVCFEVKDVATLHCITAFDIITAFDAIHDQAQPRQVLQHTLRSAPVGRGVPYDRYRSGERSRRKHESCGSSFLYTVSCMHCMAGVAGSRRGRPRRSVGEQQARQLLAEAGFAQVEVKIVWRIPLTTIMLLQSRTPKPFGAPSYAPASVTRRWEMYST